MALPFLPALVTFFWPTYIDLEVDLTVPWPIFSFNRAGLDLDPVEGDLLLVGDRGGQRGLDPVGGADGQLPLGQQVGDRAGGGGQRDRLAADLQLDLLGRPDVDGEALASDPGRAGEREAAPFRPRTSAVASAPSRVVAVV